MTTLTICPEDAPAPPSVLTDGVAIAAALAAIGVEFERWEADVALAPGATSEDVIRAYDASIAALNRRYGFQSIDVVRMTPDNPAREAARGKFLSEHVHDDFEVRFFVEGSGRFYLRAGGRVHLLDCERGDLVSVPAGMTHWFDMGERPCFTAIRFFTTPDGWVARFTGSDVASRFPAFPT
jgi:1,2-dihydroxy-3-keto-5-methylthiopentene dioxygenase